MNNEKLNDLIKRVNGDFYVGVVGSVRSGKSTFINKFFELKVLPFLNDEFVKNKILDELPQTQEGKTIMTVEPKFVPSTSINVTLDDINMNVRMVDSVGFIIPSAKGYSSEEGPRMVKTPWFSEPIDFKSAASVGTKKIIESHSNIGIVMTSDGSFGEFTRDEYKAIEEEIINEMIELDKPFVVVLNTKNPASPEALKAKNEIEEKYNANCIAINVLYMTDEDLNKIFEAALNDFKIEDLTIGLPDFINELESDIEIKGKIDKILEEANTKFKKFRDIMLIKKYFEESQIFKEVKLDVCDPSTGKVIMSLSLPDDVTDEVINEILGDSVKTKSDLIKALYQGKKAIKMYDSIGKALEMAKETGYGISIPSLEEMKLESPSLVKQNGRYGVKLEAIAPSIHMIKVDVNSVFTPIIGSEAQSESLIENLINDNSSPDGVWDKEIFGRKISEIVNDGIKAKIYEFPDTAKVKITKILDKLTNSSSNGVIAIIL